MSLNGDILVIRNGRSTSQISVYNYPEHLNPFYEDDNHKRLRFWKLNKSKDNEGRRSSFSLSGLKDIWAYGSFRLKKRSSTLGINKTSESPPTLRRRPVEEIKFERCTFPRSSLQNINFSKETTNYNGLRLSGRTFMATAASPSRSDIVRRSFTPQLTRQVENIKSKGNGLTPGLSQTSFCSLNPFEDDNRNVVLNNQIKKKRRAPPIPINIKVEERCSSDSSHDFAGSENKVNDLTAKERAEITNLTAEIENFCKITKLEVPENAIDTENSKTNVSCNETVTSISDSGNQYKHEGSSSLINEPRLDDKNHKNEIYDDNHIEKDLSHIGSKTDENGLHTTLTTLTTLTTPQRSHCNRLANLQFSETQPESLNIEKRIDKEKNHAKESNVLVMKPSQQKEKNHAKKSNVFVMKTSKQNDLRITENDSPEINNNTKDTLVPLRRSKNNISPDKLQTKICEKKHCELEISTYNPSNLNSNFHETVNNQNSKILLSSSNHSEHGLHLKDDHQVLFPWRKCTLAPLEVNISSTKRKSMKEVIESINRSQQLLNAAAHKDKSMSLQSNFNTTDNTIDIYQQNSQNANKFQSVTEIPLDTENDPCTNLDLQKLDNGEIFKKDRIKKEIYFNRESSPTASNLDWNPVPKPKRTKNV